LLDPAFLTVGAVSARMRLLISFPITCSGNIAQQPKSSTRFMSNISVAEIC
jgi:hypothetical protein